MQYSQSSPRPVKPKTLIIDLNDLGLKWTDRTWTWILTIYFVIHFPNGLTAAVHWMTSLQLSLPAFNLNNSPALLSSHSFLLSSSSS